MKFLIFELFFDKSNEIGCEGARAIKDAPNKVSGLVVKTSIISSFSIILKLIFAPNDFPIQLFCISLTLSGQFVKFSIVSKRSSA